MLSLTRPECLRKDVPKFTEFLESIYLNLSKMLIYTSKKMLLCSVYSLKVWKFDVFRGHNQSTICWIDEKKRCFRIFLWKSDSFPKVHKLLDIFDKKIVSRKHKWQSHSNHHFRMILTKKSASGKWESTKKKFLESSSAVCFS